MKRYIKRYVIISGILLFLALLIFIVHPLFINKNVFNLLIEVLGTFLSASLCFDLSYLPTSVPHIIGIVITTILITFLVLAIVFLIKRKKAKSIIGVIYLFLIEVGIFFFYNWFTGVNGVISLGSEFFNYYSLPSIFSNTLASVQSGTAGFSILDLIMLGAGVIFASIGFIVGFIYVVIYPFHINKEIIFAEEKKTDGNSVSPLKTEGVPYPKGYPQKDEIAPAVNANQVQIVKANEQKVVAEINQNKVPLNEEQVKELVRAEVARILSSYEIKPKANTENKDK